MIINKVTLIGYTRFPLSITSVFVWEPQKQEQIILGTNGSGKSSLVELLINLIGNGRHFVKDGGYTIECEHRGVHYTLTGKFPNRAGVHEFIYNGLDHNDGNTQATQRELIRTHFGMYPMVAAILTGKMKFSKMSATQRREWMMLLSGVDFDFVEKMHAHFAESLRDIKGYLNRLDTVYAEQVNEANELSDGIEAAELRVAQLRTELNTLLRAAGTPSSEGSEKLLELVLRTGERIKLLSSELIGLAGKDRPTVADLPIEELSETIPQLERAMASVRSKIASHQEQMEYFGRLAHDMGLNMGSDAGNSEQELRNKIDALHADNVELMQGVRLWASEKDNASTKLMSATAVRANLTEACVNLPADPKNRFTRAAKLALDESIRNLEHDIFHLKERCSHLEITIKHADHTKEVDCPMCHGHFKPGINVGHIERDKEELEKTGEILNGKTARLKVLQAELEEFRNYAERYRAYQQLQSGSPLIREFWLQMMDLDLPFRAPHMIPARLEGFIAEMTALAQVNENELAIETLTIRLSAVLEAGGSALIAERVHAMEEQLLVSEEKEKEYQSRLATIQSVMRDYDVFNEKMSQLNSLESNYRQKLTELLSTMLNEQVEKAIEGHHAEIGQLVNRVERYRSVCLLADSSRTERTKAEESFETYKAIVDALSPKDGLIADAIRNFVSYFGDLLNGHISLVWTYHMEVLTQADETSSLTCKFPLQVATQPQPVEDFADGSDGQVEMVDFAYQLVVMDLLKFTDYPLFVDEFGKAFDQEHRERLITYIKTLMDNQMFSQMFMISHYASVYGAFMHAEYLVLDDKNITVPGEYNHNVRME